VPELDRGGARRRALPDDADLAQDAQELRAARDARDVDRAADALEAGTHRGN
jgi:hypothetical protein